MKVTAGILSQWKDGNRWTDIDTSYDDYENYSEFDVKHILYICAVNEHDESYDFNDRLLKSRDITIHDDGKDRSHYITFKHLTFIYRELTKEIYLINTIVEL